MLHRSQTIFSNDDDSITWAAAELSGVLFGSAQLTVGEFPSSLKFALDIFCLE